MMPFEDTLTRDHPGYIHDFDVARNATGVSRDAVYDDERRKFFGGGYAGPFAIQRNEGIVVFSYCS